MQSKVLGIFSIVAMAAVLAACNNDDDPPVINNGNGDDPRVERLESIVERSNVMASTGRHASYNFVNAIGQRGMGEYVDIDRCQGSRCVSDAGAVTTITAVVDPDAVESRGTIGERGDFDTVVYWRQFEATASLPQVTYSALPRIRSYGLWGEHGYASINIMDAAVSGADLNGVNFEGPLRVASAYAFGASPETNPSGIGSATWSGIAEAASTRTFERSQGTSTITIPDLSQPSVNVDIDIAGVDISAPSWNNMPLSQGHFFSSTSNSYVSGDFYGPDHEETYGVFESGSYVGVFGAKRQ